MAPFVAALAKLPAYMDCPSYDMRAREQLVAAVLVRSSPQTTSASLSRMNATLLLVVPGRPGEPARPMQFIVNAPPAYSDDASMSVFVKVGRRPLVSAPVFTVVVLLT